MTGIRAKIEQWVRPAIRALDAYHVSEPGRCIKLDAMENPYGWPDQLVDEWLERLRGVSLNRYPDPDARVLKQRLRTAMEIPAGVELLLGNGSDELIQMIAMSVAANGRSVLAPEPTFVMYRLIAASTGMEYRGVALHAEDFGLDMPAMLAAINKYRPALVFLAYPNNPTGNLFDAEDVRRILAATPGLVVLDEAYTAFAGSTFLGETAAYDNLLILRTVSKMGLAGLRLGFLAGAPQWLAEINKTRLPYNINVLTQVSAAFALEHSAVLDEQTRRIREDRETLYRELSGTDGIHAYPSQANFILFRVPQGQAGPLFDALLRRGVLIKNLDSAAGALRDCLRVTVGRPGENDTFLSALRASL